MRYPQAFMFGRRWSKESRQTDSCGRDQALAQRNRQFDWIGEVLCTTAPMFTIRPVRGGFAV